VVVGIFLASSFCPTSRHWLITITTKNKTSQWKIFPQIFSVWRFSLYPQTLLYFIERLYIGNWCVLAAHAKDALKALHDILVELKNTQPHMPYEYVLGMADQEITAARTHPARSFTEMAAFVDKLKTVETIADACDR